MEIQVGKQSLAFAEAPYIISSASIVGKKESEGPLGNRFDVVGEDDKFGQNTWEEAESTLQKEAFTLAVGKAGLKTEDIRYLFSGDLLGQNIATSFGLMDYQVPLFGLYGACSTCGEALSLGAMYVAAIGTFTKLTGDAPGENIGDGDYGFLAGVWYQDGEPGAASIIEFDASGSWTLSERPGGDGDPAVVDCCAGNNS